MQKTKLGISVGLAGAIMYLLGLYGGILVTILAAAYILLAEENEWLKKAAVKSVVLMLGFSALSTVIYFIPSVFDFFFSILNVFGAHIYWDFLHSIANVLTSALSLLEKVLFIGLALKSFNQGSIPVPALDKFIEKYI